MKKTLALIILLILLAVLPLIGLSSYMMHILVLVIIYSMVGMAWNLLGGYCGQVSFGHAAYFGVGAYTAGILYNRYFCAYLSMGGVAHISAGGASFIPAGYRYGYGRSQGSNYGRKKRFSRSSLRYGEDGTNIIGVIGK